MAQKAMVMDVLVFTAFLAKPTTLVETLHLLKEKNRHNIDNNFSFNNGKCLLVLTVHLPKKVKHLYYSRLIDIAHTAMAHFCRLSYVINEGG